jgi:5'-nucleotidase
VATTIAPIEETVPMRPSASSRIQASRRRALAAVAALSLSAGALALGSTAAVAGGGKPTPPGNPDPRGQLVELQLLAFNDYHGHLEASTPGTLEVAGTAPAAGGSEYLSAALNQLRAGNKYSLTVAAGDLIGGSPAFSGLFHDEPSVESLNAMQLDVSSVGNHEFDEGVTELLRMQGGGCHPVDGCYFPGQPYAGADFQWLSANVINERTGKTPLPPYWVKKVNSVKVGFIGMTLEGTDAIVAAEGIQGYDFLDEVETANALVPELRAKGVESIVVLLHEGATQDPAPGDINECNNISGPVVAINSGLDPAIDAVITGHTHQPYNCLLNGPDEQPRMVTSAYSYGRVVSELNLVIDKRTGDVRRDLSTATNHPVFQSALTADPALTAVIAKWQPLFDESGNTPVGTITANITRGGTPPGTDRGVESAAGNLVADAQAWASSFNGAQVAFMNPGGVRSDLTYAQSGTEGDGVVTYGEAFTFQPFGNTLVTIPMTGSQIVSVLEEQCQPLGSSRPILHLGVSEGFTYTLDTSIVAGNCVSVSVSDVMLNGTPLAASTTYAVTVNNFLADGGDNFTTFAAVDPADRLDGGNDLEALTNYLGTFSPVAPPSIDRVTEVP